MSAFFTHTASAVLKARDDLQLEGESPAPPRPTCSGGLGVGDDYDLMMHITALFIILVTSMTAAMGPLYGRYHIERGRRRSAELNGEDAETKSYISSAAVTNLHWVLWGLKHLGTGIIIGTAFIHLLPGAQSYLTDPCLPEFFTDEYPALPDAIAMTSAFVIFLVDFFSSRYIEYLRTRAEAKDMEMQELREQAENDHASTRGEVRSVTTNDDTRPIIEDPEEVSPHQRLQEFLSVLIIESGICFHSIFIGIALELTTGSEFRSLLVAICFHQIFEGLALGSRLVAVFPDTMDWTNWKLWLCAGVYGITTPIGCAIGIAVRNDYDLGSAGSLITTGIFDSMSAGLLIYGGLVGLLSRDFINGELAKSSMRVCLAALGFVCLGLFIMGLLGRWA